MGRHHLTPLGPDGDARRAVDALLTTEDGSDRQPGSEPQSVLDLDDRWLTRVAAFLRDQNPRLETLDERREQSSGHLDDSCSTTTRILEIIVNRSSVTLQPTRGYDDPEGEDGRGFTRMWAYCKLVAAEFGCIAWDADYDEFIDLAMDEQAARELYLWLESATAPRPPRSTLAPTCPATPPSVACEHEVHDRRCSCIHRQGALAVRHDDAPVATRVHRARVAARSRAGVLRLCGADPSGRRREAVATGPRLLRGTTIPTSRLVNGSTGAWGSPSPRPP